MLGGLARKVSVHCRQHVGANGSSAHSYVIATTPPRKRTRTNERHRGMYTDLMRIRFARRNKPFVTQDAV